MQPDDRPYGGQTKRNKKTEGSAMVLIPLFLQIEPPGQDRYNILGAGGDAVENLTKVFCYGKTVAHSVLS